MKKYKFWLVTGSQDLYGADVIKQVEENSKVVAAALNASSEIPVTIMFKRVVIDSSSIKEVMLEANNDDTCAGVIVWMHTFSPAKMWISGLMALNKPLLHFNTQMKTAIPWNEIDMDYMNLNQSAHGDREFGYICARLGIKRKVIAGHYADAQTQKRIGHWTRSAVGAFESRRLKVCRFGDNMRDVAVTEGDKVMAEQMLGWSVNTWSINELTAEIDKVSDSETALQMKLYRDIYDIATENIEAVEYQAKIQVALEKLISRGKFGAFSDTFQDLGSLRQLPGLAVQDVMRKGIGFGAEGDWKTAALGRIMKLMAKGLAGGTAFMEDYTYHYDGKNSAILGAHMLEVDPDIAADKPKIEVYPLGIGGKEPPARLTFKTGDGNAILVTLTDMGDHFRMIVNDCVACTPYKDMPKLPVARVMWKPLPSLETSAEAWILAGGAHHTVLSYQLDAENMREFCEMMGIEYIHIGKDTTIEGLSKQLGMA